MLCRATSFRCFNLTTFHNAESGFFGVLVITHGQHLISVDISAEPESVGKDFVILTCACFCSLICDGHGCLLQCKTLQDRLAVLLCLQA